MNENIELNTFSVDNSTENDIQEYHEIKQDTTLDDVDTSFSSKQSTKVINEYDFFSKYDVLKADTKKVLKKKKSKKKDKSANLMDIICSELAAAAVPIVENVVTKVDNFKQQQYSYLRTNFKTYNPLKKIYFLTDAENGWNRISQTVNLSPIFPRVLENVPSDSCFIPVEYVPPTPFDEIIAKNDLKNVNGATKFLDVSIKNIVFKYHHNFSLEKLLCLKVVEKYKEYELVQTSLKEISKDIKVNRETKLNLKEDLSKVSPSKKDAIRFDQTVRNYTEKVIQLKEKQKDLLKTKKELTHKIVSLWSDIEMIRERRDRIETPYTLELKKNVVEQNEFERQWEDIFNAEFIDKLDKIEYEFVSEYLEYKEAKNEHKSVDKKTVKPQLQIDEDAIKVEAENIANNIIARDQIELDLKKDETIMSDSMSFGSHLSKNTYHFEIYIDDVFVCVSEHYSSNEMFSVEFAEHFSVQILPNNSYIRIVLFENSTIVSGLKINIAEVKKVTSPSDFEAVQFVFEDNIEPTAKHVGNGHSIKEIAVTNKVRLRSSNIFKETLRTTCEVQLKVEWNDKIEQNQSEAIKSSVETGRQIKRLLNGKYKPSFSVLLDVISQIYEKDIDDENMIETLQKLSKMEVSTDDSFPIDQNNPDFIRLKLLHLRNIGGFGNIEKKLVPLHASQISTEQLNCLQKTSEKDFDMEYLNDKEMEMDPIELQRFIGMKYVQKLNKNMMRNLNECLLQKTHKDVVRHFNFSIRSLFSRQSNVGSLATMSNSAKKKTLTESLCKEQEIHVKALRAFNLLDRSSTILQEEGDDDEKIAGFKVRPLRPFVRVSYKGVSAQTVTAIGCHPTWSHTLNIKTKLDPLSSIHINIFDEFKAQILEGFSEEDRSSKTVHYRYYNKWLGTLQIPLYTVLALGSIRGTFKITTPPLLFGYENLQAKESQGSLIPEITQLMKKDTAFITLEVTTSLSHLGGSHGYNQPLPSFIEDDYLIKHLNNFVTEYTNEFPMRNIALTFIDSAGRNKCVTQFLQPISLPEKDFLPRTPRCESAVSKSSGFSKSSSSSGKRRALDVERMSQEDRQSLYSGTVHDSDNLSKIINAALRYVSLIPSYEVMESHIVTLLGLELLKVLHGSPLDHTLLLASYFIYLGIKCWVAIGLGLPRGHSSYILIKYDITTRRIVMENDQLFRSRGFLNKGDGYTWYVCDALSGQKHELRDVGCPLKTVDFVFDNENIWVNMQIAQDCESMSFDFSRSSEWQPVFDKNVFVMKQPVVTDNTLYSSPPNVEGLRVALEAKIKAKIQKWRSHMKTIWNRYCSTLLREMLPQWEYWAFNPSGAKPGFSQKLKQLMVTYKIFGFPLNMAYINTKSVISAVKSTGLHVTDDPTVEFALGVEVYAYPNNVISVWAFLATITRM